MLPRPFARLSLFSNRIHKTLPFLRTVTIDAASSQADVKKKPKKDDEHFKVTLPSDSFEFYKLDGPKLEVDVTKKELIAMYTDMVTIRRLEMAADALYKAKKIRGLYTATSHLSTGQEAIAVGIEKAITKGMISSSSLLLSQLIVVMACPLSRLLLSLGFTLMRGGSVKSILAELLGRQDGIAHGKGGSMHMFTKGFFGGNGIVGAQVPVGAGLAFALKYMGRDNCAFTLYGDGASNQGQVFEAFNMAKLWDLPCVFACENNKYGMGTSAERSSALTEYYKRGQYIPGIKVNGMDVLAVKHASGFAKEWTTSGKGPLVLEFETYRYGGHSMSDPGVTYRTREEIQYMRSTNDAIAGLKAKILEWNVLSEFQLKEVDKEARARVEAETKEAEKSPDPAADPKTLFKDVYAGLDPNHLTCGDVYRRKISIATKRRIASDMTDNGCRGESFLPLILCPIREGSRRIFSQMMQQQSWSKIASAPKPPPQQISSHPPPTQVPQTPKPAVPQIPATYGRSASVASSAPVKQQPTKTNGHPIAPVQPVTLTNGPTPVPLKQPAVEKRAEMPNSAGIRDESAQVPASTATPPAPVSHKEQVSNVLSSQSHNGSIPISGQTSLPARVRRDSVHSTHSASAEHAHHQNHMSEIAQSPRRTPQQAYAQPHFAHGQQFQHGQYNGYPGGYQNSNFRSPMVSQRGFNNPSPAMPFNQPGSRTRPSPRASNLLPSPLTTHAQPHAQMPMGSPLQTPTYMVPTYPGYPPMMDPNYPYYAGPMGVSSHGFTPASPRPNNAYTASSSPAYVSPVGPSFGPPPMSRSASTISDAQSHRHSASATSVVPSTPKATEFQLPTKKTSAIKIINPDTKSEVVAKIVPSKKVSSLRTKTDSPSIANESEHPGSQKDSVEEDDAKAKAEVKKATFIKQIHEVKEREEREAREKVEAEEKSKAERERLAKEKEDLERKTKIDQEAAEKAKEEEAEKRKAADAEAQRMREEAARIAKQKLEEEEAALVAEEKRQAEEANAARLAKDIRKSEEEKTAQEEENRLTNEREAKVDDSKRSLTLPEMVFTSSELDAITMPPPLKKDKKIPSSLNLSLTKQINEPLPSAPLTALRTSKFINDITKVSYPEGFRSPNPALNMNAPSGRIVYDKDFLLQFQAAYTDKPMFDWDDRIRDTIGDLSGESRPTSTRSTGGRTASRVSGAPPMGSLGLTSLGPAASTLTSQQRFELSSKQGGSQSRGANATGSQPVGAFPVMGAHFKPSLGPLGSGRSASASGVSTSIGAVPGSPRAKSTRGGGSRRGGTSESKSRHEKSDMEKGLTIPIDQIKPLEASASRWKPRALAEISAEAGPALGNEDPLMTPDTVQRKVKALLNKITPNNEEKITAQILDIASQSKRETDGQTLRQVIQLTFEKATDEPNFSSVYADSARHMMDQMNSDIKDEKVLGKSGQPLSGGLLFRKYLLNRCQEDFERGWNVTPKLEGVTNPQEAELLSEEYYVAAAAKRRGLGLIKFIGELYKRSMLVEKIMHECVTKLLQNVTDPEEEEVESLCKLLTTVGGMLDKDKGAHRMTAYFERLGQLLESKIPSRMKFMVMDLIDLRKKGWLDKAAEAGPKTIAEIHADAAKAQQEAAAKSAAQSRRSDAGRGDSRGQNRNLGYGGVPNPGGTRGDGWSTVKTPNRQALAGDLSRLGMMRTNSQTSGLGPGGAFSSLRSASGNGTKKSHPARFQDDEVPSISRSGTPVIRKASHTAQSVNQFDLLNMDIGDSTAAGAENHETEDLTTSQAVAESSTEPHRERPRLNLLPKGSTLGESSLTATAADKN
ncbi:Eukaryotic translation initiation factor 4 gamma [Neolecta irregularis DAH-3]|uniref:Pyruvate dehydrogenase E1 component subunit alpha, mitochondrial n=1 Tax=Neolecta irregularis (strain DAH-3) TaxID=1198029 RepID=A0A1U7LPZ1_NEOID|nr:Eukaryotic translation initiation factor 4 gamma [Neolecta irregularis DAH-3]|eukprot:OLL24653.1 Eukaryotic translation initiation factor 4 gamma [Neolecta irregularis DAH-3]